MAFVSNGLNRIYSTQEIDLEFWDRVSPVLVSSSGTGTAVSNDTRIGSEQPIEILITDEFDNDVFPQTVIDSCSTTRRCSFVWTFDEDIGPRIGSISKKLKFVMIGRDTDGLLRDRQSSQDATLDSFSSDFVELMVAPKLIPNFELLGAQVSTKTNPLFSSAEVLSRFRVSAPDLFADVEYQVNSTLRDDDLTDIMIQDVFTRSISKDEIDIFDNAFSDPSVFALNKPRLDVVISIDGNQVFEFLNIPLAKVEFVELPPEPEPLPPLPEPIPDPDPVPQPGDPPLPPPPEEIPKNNTKRNVAIAGIALVGVAAIALRR